MSIRCKIRTSLPKIWIILLLVGIVCTGRYEQILASENAINPLLDERRLAVLYDSENGMPTSEANVIVQTPDGFIWIGGYSGLVRYDGIRFEQLESTKSITSVVSMYVDSKGRLWVGTNDKGVALYEDGKIRFFNRESGLNSCSVKSLAEDKNGNIYLGTTEGVSYIDSDMNVNHLHHEKLCEEYISCMQQDKWGNIYGVTLKGNVFMIRDLSVTTYLKSEQIKRAKVVSVYPDETKQGKVYLGTVDNEIIHTNLLASKHSYRIILTGEDVSVNKMYRFSKDCMIVCTDTGIGYLNKYDSYTKVKDLPMYNSIDNTMIDYEGNIWFASSRQGVMKLAKTRFTDISLICNMKNQVVNTTCAYQKMLYIGTDKGLFLIDETRRQRETTLTKLLKGERIRCIRKDSKDNLWICTYGNSGLICYHTDGTYESYTEKQGLSSAHIRTVLELSNGDMAVSSSGGIDIIREKTVIKSYGEKEGLKNTEILCLEEGENGTLYAGSDGAGIFVINGDIISCIDQTDGLESEVIMRIKQDRMHGGYWIITGNSIAYLENEKIRTISSFPYSNNFDIFYDIKERAWILSGNGIYCVDSDKLYSNVVSNYVYYDSSLGLPCNTTANSRSYLAEDGTLYISGVDGVSSININEMEEAVEDVKLAVPYVRLDNQIVYVKDGETIHIPTDCKRVTIYGYVLNYSLYNPMVSCYLEGFDETPQITNRMNLTSATYTNLESREYKFHIAVLDSTTGHTMKETTIYLEKDGQLYQQPWFIMLLFGIVSLILIAVTHVYTRKRTVELLKKQKQIQTFKNQMIRAFSKAIDVKDKYTNGHSARVAEYSQMIARRMGCRNEEIEQIYSIALLHDIGKIFVPDYILNKPQPLTDEEFEVMKHHAQYGYDILKEIDSMPDMALGAGYHHERLDGNGYPGGVRGEEIPFSVRIIAAADTFDAMNSDRPYRERMRMDIIIEELEHAAGTQLDANVVEALLDLIRTGRIT